MTGVSARGSSIAECSADSRCACRRSTRNAIWCYAPHPRRSEPEGRRGQDHHRGQSRRRARAGGPARAAGRSRPAGQRHDGQRRRQAQRRAHRLPRAARPGRARRHPQRAPRAAATTWCRRTASSPAPRSSWSSCRRAKRASRSALERVAADYDFILIDCPPSLSLLTVNALAAAQRVLIPMQCEYYALEGLSDLVGTIKRVRANLNPYARDRRPAAHDVRPAQHAVAAGLAAARGALRRQGVPHAGAAQRAARRGAELRHAGGGLGRDLEGRAGLHRARAARCWNAR